MKKTVLTTAFLLGVFSIQAQEFFSEKRPVQTETEFTRRVNDISYDIDVIIKTNKDKLKEALNEIEKQVENNELTKEEADKLRNEKAEFYAQKIEEDAKLQEERIKKLINNKIEDNINFSTDMSAYQKQLIENKTKAVIEYAFGQSIMLGDKSTKDVYNNRFLHSFGGGLGAGVKTRVGNAQSRVFWKSTFDFGFHYLKLNGNNTIENSNNETILVDTGFPLKKSFIYTIEYRLSNYLEYDFSKRKFDEFGNPIIKSRQSFYAGLGGFFGYSQLGKQLNYELDGEKYRETTVSKFNSNPFVYGVGGYVGYQNWSLKATYNLNNVFKKSFADQNIFSIGLVLNLY
ncbi:MAG TPA: hypothetical protein VKY82_01375 [Flavobacterium sp.]|nr:hypothetical protein [Flavobacterium sp.]